MKAGMPKVGTYSEVWQDMPELWMLDEVSGNAIGSRNGYILTPTGVTQGITGVINKAMDFDGINDYAANVDTAFTNLLQGLSSWTLSFWTASSYSVADYGCAVCIGDESEDDGLAVYPYVDVGSGQVAIYTQGGSEEFDSGHAEDAWVHHCVRQKSDFEIEYFVSGFSVGSYNPGVGLMANTDFFCLGVWYPSIGEDYEGKLDQVRFFTTDLSGQAILTLARF